MHAHAHHDHICIIFEGSQAEKKSYLIRYRCIIMFHELEKMTLLYGWFYKYALPQLISHLPLTKTVIRLLFCAKHRWANLFGSHKRKIPLTVFQ